MTAESFKADPEVRFFLIYEMRSIAGLSLKREKVLTLQTKLIQPTLIELIRGASIVHQHRRPKPQQKCCKAPLSEV